MTDKLTSIRIDPQVWQDAKIQAIRNREPLKTFLERALKTELAINFQANYRKEVKRP